MKHSNGIRAALLCMTAASLLAPCATTAGADSLVPATKATRHSNVDVSKEALTSAPSSGSTTTRIEPTAETMRFWTNRAQRGTRTANVGHR
jgi:hypothetical protein